MLGKADLGTALHPASHCAMLSQCDYLERGVLRHMALCQTSDSGRGLHVLILHVPVDQR